MRRQRGLVALAIASVASAVACNAIIGLSGDYDVAGDSGVAPIDGHVDTTTPDGTTPVGDGTVATTDTGTPDSGPPPDACPADIEQTIDAGNVPTVAEQHTDCPGNSNIYFCWNFNGDAAPPNYGWTDNRTTAGAVITQEGANLDEARDNRFSIPLGAAVPASAGLLWEDWDSFHTPTTNDPLPFPKGNTVTATFNFKVTAISDVTLIGAFTLSNFAFGVSVIPTPCGGRPRVAANAAPPGATAGGAFIDLNVFYAATITLTHQSDDSLTGSVKVGSVNLWSGSTGLPSLQFDDKVSPPTLPVHVQVGLFNDATSYGNDDISIDDVLVTQ